MHQITERFHILIVFVYIAYHSRIRQTSDREAGGVLISCSHSDHRGQPLALWLTAAPCPLCVREPRTNIHCMAESLNS
jgi:hypothetical protein